MGPRVPGGQAFLPVQAWIRVCQLTRDSVGSADQAHVTVSTDLPSGLAPVWGDDELLDQMVTSVVANAIRCTPAEGSVRVSPEAVYDRVTLRVADTGIGIAEEDLPRVFDEFYRTKGGREFTTRGTGLGLAIVKSIADTHEAEVSVESHLGEGTTFTIRFLRADRVSPLPAVGPGYPSMNRRYAPTGVSTRSSSAATSSLTRTVLSLPGSRSSPKRLKYRGFWPLKGSSRLGLS